MDAKEVTTKKKMVTAVLGMRPNSFGLKEKSISAGYMSQGHSRNKKAICVMKV